MTLYYCPLERPRVDKPPPCGGILRWGGAVPASVTFPLAYLEHDAGWALPSSGGQVVRQFADAWRSSPANRTYARRHGAGGYKVSSRISTRRFGRWDPPLRLLPRFAGPIPAA